MYKRSNPRRTDISLVDCHTSRIYEFDYHYLPPAITDRKSYMKQKTELTEK